MSIEIRLKVTEYFRSFDTLYHPMASENRVPCPEWVYQGTYGFIGCDTKVLDWCGLIEFSTHPLDAFKYVCPLAIAVCDVDTFENNYSTLLSFTHKGLFRFHSDISRVKPPYGIIASSEDPCSWRFYEHRRGRLEPIAKPNFEYKVIQRGNKSIRWARNKIAVWRSEWQEVASIKDNRVVGVLTMLLFVVILILLAILFPQCPLFVDCDLFDYYVV